MSVYAHDASIRLPDDIEQIKNDNLRHLIEILDETIPDEKIMKAEINRELGQVDIAIKLLEGLPENFHWIVSILNNLSLEKDKKVAVLSKPTPVISKPEIEESDDLNESADVENDNMSSYDEKYGLLEKVVCPNCGEEITVSTLFTPEGSTIICTHCSHKFISHPSIL